MDRMHSYEKNQAFLEEKYSMESKEQIFDEIQIGEVIYAKMPFREEKLEKIPPLHRQRPYIVVGKRENTLIAYPSSHKTPNHQNEDHIFRIHSSLNKYYHRAGEIFRSWTDSHYDLKKAHFIPIENIIEVFQIPEYSDIQRLERQLVMLKNKGKKVFLMDIEFPIKEGDFLSFKKENYYVYSSYKDEIFAHIILKREDYFKRIKVKKPGLIADGDIEITLNEENYVILAETREKLKKSDCKNLLFSASKREIEKIVEIKKQHKQMQKQFKNRDKILKQTKFWYNVGEILHFRYGYEKYLYLYSYKNVFYAIQWEQYQEFKERKKTGAEYPYKIEIIKLTDGRDYDAREEMADMDIMRAMLEEAFDDNQADIRDLLLKEFRTEEEKFRDLILPMEESSEILLRYYGFSL